MLKYDHTFLLRKLNHSTMRIQLYLIRLCLQRHKVTQVLAQALVLVQFLAQALAQVQVQVQVLAQVLAGAQVLAQVPDLIRIVQKSK